MSVSADVSVIMELINCTININTLCNKLIQSSKCSILKLLEETGINSHVI